MTLKKQARNDKRKQKKLADPLMFFLAKKRGVTIIGQWLLPRPKGNHYSHAEIVHIISIAPSWHPNISSEPFAAGRPRPRALPALPPCGSSLDCGTIVKGSANFLFS